MARAVVLFALSALGILVPLACGGETDSGGSGGGGASTGGSGGAGVGGTGGTSGVGGAASGGTSGAGGGGGTAGCPGAMPDCVVCSQLVGGICENGSWHCPDPACPDGGCPSWLVPTADGCLGCADVSSKLSTGIEAARAANASCGAETDCVLTSAGTTCAGACPIAVSKSGETAFQAALTKLDGDYCKSFVDKCGYSTPKCAVPTLVCNSGKCEAKFN